MNEVGDWIDQSVTRAEEQLARDLAVRRPGGPGRREDGCCANDCGASAMEGGAFCSASCRDDWQYRERMRGMAGREE